MDDAEHWPHAPQPLTLQDGGAVRARGLRPEQFVPAPRQRGNQHDERRRAEILLPGGADAQADAADPVGNVGALPQERENVGKIAGECVAGVEETEIGTFGQRAQLVGAGGRRRGPAIGGRMRGDKARGRRATHPCAALSARRCATRGAMRSAMMSAPRAVGWSPSLWLSAGSSATPSRKKG